jgi:hypothetical protein
MGDRIRLAGRFALIFAAARTLPQPCARAHGARVVVNDPGCGMSGRGGDDGIAIEVVREIGTPGGKALTLAPTIDRS